MIEDASGNVVTSNYDITTTPGTLTITGQSINSKKEDGTDDLAYKGVTVTAPDNTVYNGQSQKLKPTVKDANNNPLTEGSDYELEYSKDTTNVGTVTVTIKGKGNYSGTVTTTYQITPAPIKEEDETDTPRFTISEIDSVVYNGTSQKQAPVIKDGDKELKEGQDYKLTYSEDTTNAGEITVTIEGLGNYAGKVSKTYTIMKVNSSANLSGISSKYNGSNQILVTDAKVEGGTIYYSLDGKTYSTTMPEKKEAGTYTIYYYVKADKNHNDLGSESKPLTVEAKITEEKKVESESKVKTSTATHTLFFETMGVAAAGLFIALRKRMNK